MAQHLYEECDDYFKSNEENELFMSYVEKLCEIDPAETDEIKKITAEIRQKAMAK